MKLIVSAHNYEYIEMRWSVANCALLLTYVHVSVVSGEAHGSIVELGKDFSNVKTDAGLAAGVKEILDRLRMFKVAVHPRIRIFYELLKKGIADHVHRTSDTLYNTDKYNHYNNDEHSDDD